MVFKFFETETGLRLSLKASTEPKSLIKYK